MGPNWSFFLKNGKSTRLCFLNMRQRIQNGADIPEGQLPKPFRFIATRFLWTFVTFCLKFYVIFAVTWSKHCIYRISTVFIVRYLGCAKTREVLGPCNVKSRCDYSELYNLSWLTHESLDHVCCDAHQLLFYSLALHLKPWITLM